MERMQLQGPIITSLWGEQAAAAATQVPFLALLQGAMAEELQEEGDNKRRQHALAEDAGLLESCCATQAAGGHGKQQRRRRKRARAAAPEAKRKKPAEEAECQRMTHIAVERNRRRLMNDHLASLRSLIPSDYIPRGDQATVVGGAIDYVKQLEQQLVALQAAARRGSVSGSGAGGFVAPQHTSYSEQGGAAGVDVEAMAAVGGHVRVRVAGRRWPGRLVRAVAAMEDLRLAVLHLAVTSVGRDAVVYCFNLKIEEGCQVATADEVAAVVHQIFAYAAGVGVC